MDLLRQELFKGLTVFQAASIVGGVVVLLVLGRFLLRTLRSESPGPYHARMKCRDCGWTGVTGKHIPKCVRCGSPNLRPL